MNEDLHLMNEYQAVKRLIAATKASYYVYFKAEGDVWEPEELLEELGKRFDHEQRYFLDNGPRDNEPGVYMIAEDGEIDPDRLYAPAGKWNNMLLTSDSYGYRPWLTHFDFGPEGE